MKAALHRSVTFWAGLLVMGFVCWGWYRSSSFLNAGGNSFVYLGNIGSGIFVSHDEKKSPDWHWVDEPITGGMPLRIALPSFAMQTNDMERPFVLGSRDEVMASTWPGAWVAFLPHWLILLAVATVWLLLLSIRARRRRKTVINP
ncbi:hypothetical protein [Haloferula sp. BvORR071]|uniref:hypothetical protein n=1 Tax=Haloferula sp. BvORR071 TaxID=1396141 RepID=UPI0005576BF5|nr:hypothetical protein [Haloferula sp. BvORR071]